MYRKKEELQFLINTLSASEKRAFFAYANKYSKSEKAIYVQLFEDMAKGKEPKMNTSSPQALTIAKRNLYQNILKSLREFHQNKPEAQLQNMISDVEILYDKNLPDQSMRILNKSKEEAYKSEKFGILLQILEWERKLIALIDAPPRPVAMIAEEEREVTRKLNNIFDQERLHAKAIEYKRKYGYIRGEAILKLKEDIIDAQELKDVLQCHSQKALYYFYYTKSLSHFMIFDYEISYAYSKLLIGMNSNVIPLHDYLNAILHHTTSCICSGKFNETLRYLHKAQILINDKQLDLLNILSLKVFYYKSNYEMVCHFYKGKVPEMKQKIKEIEESLSKFEERIPIEMRQVINSTLRNGYLAIGAMKDVDRIIDATLGKEMKLIRNDIYDDLLLFRLFWLLQCQSYDILPSVALSTYRYFSSYNQVDSRYDIELMISKYFMKEYDFANRKIKQQSLKELLAIFENHIEVICPENQFLEHYSYYVIWIESLMEECPFAEAAAKWYAKKIDD